MGEFWVRYQKLCKTKGIDGSSFLSRGDAIKNFNARSKFEFNLLKKLVREYRKGTSSPTWSDFKKSDPWKDFRKEYPTHTAKGYGFELQTCGFWKPKRRRLIRILSEERRIRLLFANNP